LVFAHDFHDVSEELTGVYCAPGSDVLVKPQMTGLGFASNGKNA